MQAEEVERAAALCAEAGAWLVMDNTCELSLWWRSAPCRRCSPPCRGVASAAWRGMASMARHGTPWADNVMAWCSAHDCPPP